MKELCSQTVLSLGLFFFLSLFLVWPAPLPAASVTISCGAVGREIELCREGAEKWARKSGHTVNVVSAPNNSTDRLALYLQLLAAGSSDIDVFVMDTTWPGILSGFFLELNESFPTDLRQEYFPAFIDNNTIANKFIAVPWWIDVGLLYYRTDLLKKYNRPVPKTWDELTETAQIIQDGERKKGQSDLWGYVFQGRAYEGLTCNALEWIASYNGGTIVDHDGKVSINNPNAIKALSRAQTWIGKISPKGVLNYGEEEARGVFQTGKAVFLRNWPYIIRLGNSPDSPIRGKFSFTALPRGNPTDESEGKHVATLGGWSLGVSKFSKHPKEAIELIRYLTGPAEQKRRAKIGGFYPTLTKLYQDPQIQNEFPKVQDLFAILKQAVPRPSQITGRKYNQVSAEFWEAVHSTLSGQSNPREGFQQLQRRLLHIGRNGKW